MAQQITHLARKHLKRVLTVADLFGVGYGDVGSSIYYALGVTALYALGATPIAMLLAGLFFICTAMTYAEMSTTFPESGGSATFTRHAFNDLWSFVAGWGLLLDYIVTTAISAYAIPPYLRSLFHYVHIPYDGSIGIHLMMTIGIIGGLLLLNIRGVKESGRVSVILTSFTICTQLLILLLAGFFVLNFPYVLSHMRVGVVGLENSPTWPNFLKGVAMAMVAYTGIEAISQLASETKSPGIMIPRAMRWVVLVILVLYSGISIVGLSVISPQELGTTYLEDPITGIVAHLPIGGSWLAPWVGVIAAIVLLACANAGLLGASRLTFSMGEYYQLPKFFYRLHERYQTPYLSLTLFAVIASLVVLASRGQMLFLADIYNFGAQIAFFFAHASLIVLRMKQPTLARPYRAPLNISLGQGKSIPVTAILGALISLAVWIVVVVTKIEGRFFGLSWLCMGMLMYVCYRKKHRLSPTGHVQIEAVQVPGYVPVHLREILTITDGDIHPDTLQMACQFAEMHHAKLTIAHILEVPLSMPMEARLIDQELMGEMSLKRAEAVAREHNLEIAVEAIRARSKEEALSDLLKQDHFDLVVLEVAPDELKKWGQLAATFKEKPACTPARFLFCTNLYSASSS